LIVSREPELPLTAPKYRNTVCYIFTLQTSSHPSHTFKALIGVAPNGAITFVSDLYPDSVFDKQVVVHSKLLDQNQMKAGDVNTC